ncbi:hypothetical protein [Streptomyces sp. NPDC008139]|uniref:hypothetical protein n=1 Tax=Streptomyces sp. NPDC008139 TaxID=3364814 RepID=UPI0036E95A9A
MRKVRALLAVAAVVAVFAWSQHTRQQTAALPDLRGLSLTRAQLAAQTSGFHQITSEDALGRNRSPMWSSNWTVCSQHPSPARYNVSTVVIVSVVKSKEKCPHR